MVTTKRFVASFFLLLLTGLSSTSCHKEYEVNLRVSVKDNRGDKLPGATIKFNEQSLGNSDANGTFEKVIKIPSDKPGRLEVAKESDQFYYAPYFKQIDPKNVGSEQNLEVILYFVPKPKAGDSEGNIADRLPDDVKEIVVAADNDTTSKSAEATTPAPTSLKTEEATASDKPSVATMAGTKSEDNEPDNFVEKTILLNPPYQDDATVEKPFSPSPVPEKRNITYTVHVLSDRTPVGEAEVLIGTSAGGDLSKGCATNSRGRCVLHLPEVPKDSIAIVVQKPGFHTEKISTRIQNRGEIRVHLTSGYTLDIFALSKTYNFKRGIPNIGVYIGKRQVGKTDSFGHFAYYYKGAKDDLIEVALKSPDQLPEEFATDFVSTSTGSLTKYFTPKEPPPARVSLLQLRAGGGEGAHESGSLEYFEKKLRPAIAKHLFTDNTLREYPLPAFVKNANESDRTFEQLVREGWVGSSLANKVDFLVLPVFTQNADGNTLELTLIDNKGKAIGAAKSVIADVLNPDLVVSKTAGLVTALKRSVPFEGAVTEVRGSKVSIDLGHGSARGVRAGDYFEIYGTQTTRDGNSKETKKIGLLKVLKVNENASICEVKKMLPRARILRGDLAILKPGTVLPLGKLASGGGRDKVHFRVIEEGGEQARAVRNANLYFSDRWVGATDDQGLARVNTSLITGGGELRISKYGFRDSAQKLEPTPKREQTFALQRESAFLRLQSSPPGLAVLVDGKELGKTPLFTQVPVPSGFVKLEIKAPNGYKSYSKVLELEEGTLDLTGKQTIDLEIDYLSQIARLLEVGKIDNAIAKIIDIPKEHSDYLHGRHKLGELYLTVLSKPAEAAGAFAEVTQTESVKSFQDKRFIPSYINEGIALYFTGDDNAENAKEVAVAHYRKAIEVLESVRPYVRFINADAIAAANNNLYYYKALSKHKIWRLTQAREALEEAHHDWEEYLQHSESPANNGKDLESYRENARVFLKQASASLQKDAVAQ